ncbi:hypothetical protein MAR_014248, partial [Mya arenaria]
MAELHLLPNMAELRLLPIMAELRAATQYARSYGLLPNMPELRAATQYATDIYYNSSKYWHCIYEHKKYIAGKTAFFFSPHMLCMLVINMESAKKGNYIPYWQYPLIGREQFVTINAFLVS